MARRQPRPRVRPLPLLRRPSPRRARPRADRRRHSPRPPLGAIRGSIRSSVSWRVQRAVDQRAAAIWPAAIRVCASSGRIARDGCSGGRAQTAATAHHDRLLGRSAARSASPPRGASNAPRIDLRGEGGVLWYRPVGRQHGCRKTGQLRLRADRRHWPPQPPPGAIPAAIDISISRSVRQAVDVGAAAI